MKHVLVVGLLFLGLSSHTAIANEGSERLQDLDEFAGYMNRSPKSKGFGPPWARDDRPLDDFYLAELIHVDCTREANALRDSILSEANTTVRYLIVGICDLRGLGLVVVGKGIIITGNKDLEDQLLPLEDIPTLLMDRRTRLAAGSQGVVRLEELMVEYQSDDSLPPNITFGAFGGSLDLLNVGVRTSSVFLAGTRGGAIHLINTLVEQQEDRSPALTEILDHAPTGRVFLRSGSDIQIFGGAYSLDLFASTGSSIQHAGLYDDVPRGTLNYEIEGGSSATLLNPAVGEISDITVRSGSTFSYLFREVVPDSLYVSESSYYGPLRD